MQLAERFAAYIEQHKDFSMQDKVLVAVSGGVDSVVLLDLLQRLPEAYRPQLSIAHVDHQLRAGSHNEKRFVEEISRAGGYPFYSYTWPKKDHPSSGIEKAARDQRYQFFSRIMEENGLNKLVTGHHRGDQAETVLMRIVRGSALEHLSGIKAVRSFDKKTLVRPLLDVSKADLYRYAKLNQLKYVEDESNQQLDYSRNRYRNKIIPLLEKENVAVEEHLSDLSKEVADIWSIAKPLIETHTQRFASIDEEIVEIKIDLFLEESISIQRQGLKMILNHLYDGTRTTYKQKHIALIIDWLKGSGPNSKLDLPGPYQAIRSYQTLRIQQDDRRSSNKSLEPTQLNVGEWIYLSNNKKIGLFDWNELPENDPEGKKVVLAKDSIALPLTVRNRQTGDRITLLGMSGSKKVKDILIDKKIPRDQRDELVLIEDAEGKLLWIIDVQESRLSIQSKPDKMHYVLFLEET